MHYINLRFTYLLLTNWGDGVGINQCSHSTV